MGQNTRSAHTKKYTINDFNVYMEKDLNSTLELGSYKLNLLTLNRKINKFFLYYIMVKLILLCQ